MADVSTIFVITVLTSKMFMPGMPDMSNMPGMPAGFKIPGMEANRTMSMRLTSPNKANSKSTAKCNVPEKLLLGKYVDLEIPLPEKTKDTAAGNYGTEKQTKPEKMIIKQYWGCGSSVPSGQPRVMDTSSSKDMQKYTKMSKQQKNRMYSMMENDNGSYAYYPGRKAKKIDAKSQAPGKYELVTNYTGGTDFTLEDYQDFLAPFEIKSPKDEVDLTKAIKIEWRAIPNAVGYIITAFGSNKNETIMWTSASSPEMSIMADTDAYTKEETDKMIKSGLMLGPDVTICNIPAGIFENTKSPMLMLKAFGRDEIQNKDGIKTNVLIRSEANLMLGNMGKNSEDSGNNDEESAPPPPPFDPGE